MHPPPSSPPPSSASHPAPPPPCALLSAALTADVVRSLLESQRRLPVYLGRSPQLFARRYLVDWLAAVGGEHALCPTARCLAVVLLDYFMDRFDIQQQQLRLVALCCLLVAGWSTARQPALRNVCSAANLALQVLLIVETVPIFANCRNRADIHRISKIHSTYVKFAAIASVN